MASSMKVKIIYISLILLVATPILYFRSNNSFKLTNSTSSTPEFKEFRKVIKRNCSSCHDYYLKMDEKEWVQSNLVTPSSLEQSRIYSSIRGSNVGGDEDMPPKVSISKDDIETIKTWIHGLSKYEDLFSKSRIDETVVTFSKNKKLSNTEVFERCFIQISGKRPEASNGLFQQVSSGKILAQDACYKALKESSYNADRTIISNHIAKDVRDTFHRFFTSWFSNYAYFRAGATFISHDIYPMDGAALTMSYVMWKDKHYREVLLTEGTLEAVRESNISNNKHLFFESPIERKKFRTYKYGDTKSKGKSKPWTPIWLPRGKIIDIKKKRKFQSTPWYVNRDMNVILFKEKLILDKDLIGANTTQSYILNNLGRDPGEINNGGLVIPRTWSKKVIQDFLCRDLPVVRIEDTKNYLQKNSNIKFRTKSSCMQCHTTIDPMAGALRNAQAVYTSSDGDSSIHIKYFNQTEKNKGELLPDVDRKFHKRQPTGRFIYRSNSGKLIDKSFDNILSLNKAIVDTDDYYQCATKKLFYYMTGINVTFRDDIFNKTTDARSLYLLKLIQQLSQDFKKSGDIKKLTRDIINLELYQQDDFGGFK